MMPSFNVLQRGNVTCLKIQQGTFSFMIIYIHTLKISVIWTNSMICYKMKFIHYARINLSFLDNGIKLSNLYVPNIKKEIKTFSAWKARGKDHPQSYSSAHRLLQGHVCLLTLNVYFLKN